MFYINIKNTMEKEFKTGDIVSIDSARLSEDKIRTANDQAIDLESVFTIVALKVNEVDGEPVEPDSVLLKDRNNHIVIFTAPQHCLDRVS